LANNCYNACFVKDKNNIYLSSRVYGRPPKLYKMEEVDYQTFEIFEKNKKIYAKDKNRTYYLKDD
jgi:hypothetical protein